MGSSLSLWAVGALWLLGASGTRPNNGQPGAPPLASRKPRAGLVWWVGVGCLGWGGLVVAVVVLFGSWLAVWPLVLCRRFCLSVTFRPRLSCAVMPRPSGPVLFPALLPSARRAIAGGPGLCGVGCWLVLLFGFLVGSPFCSRPPCIHGTRSDKRLYATPIRGSACRSSACALRHFPLAHCCMRRIVLIGNCCTFFALRTHEML